MPHRIIFDCIVPGMKPYELIAALMQREKLGALPLAKRMNKPTLQPQIHRFINGNVANPARTTAVPLAAYFNLPVDAIYDEAVATTIAIERGIRASPAIAGTAKRPRSKLEVGDLSPDEIAAVMALRAAKAMLPSLRLASEAPPDVEPVPGATESEVRNSRQKHLDRNKNR